jgi:hypothetical protein
VTNTLPDFKTALETTINGFVGAKFAGVGLVVSIDTFTSGVVATQAGVLRLTSNSPDQPNVTIRSAAANDFAAPMMFGIDNGGIEVARYSNMRPVPNGTFFSGLTFSECVLRSAAKRDDGCCLRRSSLAAPGTYRGEPGDATAGRRELCRFSRRAHWLA